MEDSTKVKKKKNHRKRHKVLYKILHPVVRLFLKCKFGYKYKIAKNLPEKYIVVSNHTTDYDPLLVSATFKNQMYFVASEHITRWKTAYKFINFVFEPIIRYKGTSAITTVRDTLRKVKDGDSVCIFAEGVRSWNGETGEISLSTAKMIKSAKCALITHKIEGGYLVSPIWSEHGTRKGDLSGKIVGIYSADELANMTDEEVLDIIKRDIYENAFLDKEPKRYKGKKLAEGLENLLFICPECHSHDSFTTQENSVRCKNCGLHFDYNEYGLLENIHFKNVYEFSEWQRKEIKKDVENNTNYTASHAVISIIQHNHSKNKYTEGVLSLNREYLICGDFKIPTSEISSMAIFGRHGLVFSAGRTYYEIIPDKNFSALKFLLYFNSYLETKSKEN